MDELKINAPENKCDGKSQDEGQKKYIKRASLRDIQFAMPMI